MQKQNPITNLRELRYKMAEKFAALENGEITVSDAKAFTGIASVIVSSCKVEMIDNQMRGVKDQIDFLDYDNSDSKKGNRKLLVSEFEDKKLR